MTGAGKEVLAHRASRAQQRLWFVEQLVPGEPVNNISFEFTYPARVDVAALRAATADVVARHEALRTMFRVRDSVLWQVVLTPPGDPPVEFVDLSGLPEQERGPAYRELCDRAGTAVFDLGTAPLLRLLHVRRDERHDALVIVLHHAVADAASTEVVVRELGQAYEARLAGRAPGWAELDLQYADFTAWQEEQLTRPEARKDLDYWRAQLAGLSTLDLTHGRARPAEMSQRGARIDVVVDEGTAAALAAFLRAERATPFMALLAAYAAALGRVFGAEDIAVSSSVAGRPLPEVQQVVGMFVDRVVLRLDLSAGPTFRQLVAAARQVVADAHDHSSVTFDQIVDAIGPDRELGVTPLAQAAINLQPRQRGRVHSSVLPRPVEGGLIDTRTVGHDLVLDLVEEQSRYAGTVRYRFGVVSADAADRVATLFNRFLRAGLAEPDRPLWTFPAVQPEELDRLHAAVPGPAVPGPVVPGPVVPGPVVPDPVVPDPVVPDPVVPGPAVPGPAGHRLAHELVAACARRVPHAPAVVGPSRALDFAELEARANRLARALRENAGVGAEVPVLVAVPRSPELVVAMLAVLKAGGVYVPVDPTAPAAYLATVAGRLGARLALALPGAGTALPESVTVLDLDLAMPAPPDPGPPDVVVRPGNAAYVLFTSGSTGPPKGVVVEHRNLAAYVHALLDRLVAPAGASFLMVQAPTFDSCLTSIFGALANAGPLHLVDEDTAADPWALAAHLERLPADFVKTTPSHLAALLAAGDRAALRPRRALILAGEASSREFTGRLLAAGWRIFAHYGPTETTVGVGADWLSPGTGAWSRTTPLGRPLAGVGAYVLDGRLQPVPPGCLGELYVGGPQVSRGYAGSAAGTAAVYLPDPFAGRPGARMYRTGDLVRRQPEGTFEYCGRTDRQVKVRGYRVEPGAAEAVLEAHPDVARAAVVPRGPEGRRRLVAYVVPAGPGADPARLRELPVRLREFAGRTLPGYAVPTTIIVLEKLPMTPHGKLDVAALPDAALPDAAHPDAAHPDPAHPDPAHPDPAYPDPALSDAALTRPAAPPRQRATRQEAAGPTEQALLESWRAALPGRDFGVADGFFDVGGDSILAIHVVADARRRGVPLTVRHLFGHQTIRAIAELLGETVPEHGAASGPLGLAGRTAVRIPVTDMAGAQAAFAGLVERWPALRVVPAEQGWRVDPDTAAVLDPARCADPPVIARWAPDAVHLSIDPARLDDRSIGLIAAALSQGELSQREPSQREPSQGDTPPIGPAAGAVLPAPTLAALRGEAHEAYGTSTTHLVAAATLAALGADNLLLLADAGDDGSGPRIGQHATPALVRLDPLPGEPGELVQVVKAAIRAAAGKAAQEPPSAAGKAAQEPPSAAGKAAQEPPSAVGLRVLELPDAVAVTDLGASAQRVVVTFAADRVILTGPGGAGLAERVRDRLVDLVTHCRGAEPVYSELDFPDAGLDDSGVAALLSSMGIGPADAPSGGPEHSREPRVQT